MNEQLAKKAAKWWADQLRSGAKLDHGDNSLTGNMTQALAYMSQDAERQGQTTEQIDTFESALAEILLETEPKFVGVDYHPDITLQQAADTAGLGLGMTTLPWKTSMHFKGEAVFVSCGYGAPSKEL